MCFVDQDEDVGGVVDHVQLGDGFLLGLGGAGFFGGDVVLRSAAVGFPPSLAWYLWIIAKYRPLPGMARVGSSSLTW